VHQRGAKTMVCADDDVPFSESSCTNCGTCLQVCPTGALSARRSAYAGHPSECQRVKSTCLACAVGCGIRAMVRGNTLLGIEGDWEGNTGGLLCVTGRFESLHEPASRIRKPLVRKDGQLVETTWDEAIAAAAKGFSGASSIAGFITPRTVNETMIAFVAFLNEVLKSDQVSLLHGQAPMELAPRATLSDVAEADCIIVIGGDPLSDQKVLGYLIRRSYDRHAKLIIINDGQTSLDDLADQHLHLRAVSHDSRSPFEMLRYSYHLSLDGISQFHKAVDAAQRPVIAYGPDLSSAVYATMRQLGPKVKFMPLVQGANAAGAARYGIESRNVEAETLFVLAGDDLPNGQALPPARFSVVQDAWQSAWTDKADVVLPAALWSEQAGHYASLDGRVQQAVQAVTPPEGVRDNVAILSEVAKHLNIPVKQDWTSALHARKSSVVLSAN
jgi:formate dehydrogenase major subunit